MQNADRPLPPPISKQNEVVVEQLRKKFVPMLDRLPPEIESAATFDVAAQSTLMPSPKTR
jgi:hypothetical protein